MSSTCSSVACDARGFRKSRDSSFARLTDTAGGVKFAVLRREISSLTARDLCNHYIKFHMAVAAFKSVRNKTCETTWHFAIVLNFANALYFSSVRDKILRGALLCDVRVWPAIAR